MHLAFRCVLAHTILLAVPLVERGWSAAPARPVRPNILFCVADDASYPYMSAYGCSWVQTPGFDQVARQGLLFRHAYTPNAKCAPSRASILTGRNPWQLKEACNHWCFFPTEFKTYPEVLAEHGYFVGKTAKGWAPGIARDAKGTPRQLAGTPYESRTTLPPTKGISNTDYAGNFRDFLAAAPAGKPWCFWYGCREPHRGYEYGSGVAKGGKQLSQIDRVPDFWPEGRVVRNDMLDYAFELEHFDRHLVAMLAQLKQRGELENTLVVVTADNGMPFPRVKGQEYEMSNHMPLAIMWPRGIKNPGRTIEDYVSFIDFAPTFLELAGVAWNASGMQPSTGRSLRDLFTADTSGLVNPARDHVLIGKERHDVGRPHDWGYPIRGIVQGGMLYLHNFEPARWPAGNPETGYLNCDGSPTKTVVLRTRGKRLEIPYWQLSFGKRASEELYNVHRDPECITNLADQAKYQQLKQSLQEQLFAELRLQQDPRMAGNGRIFDQYPYADPATANFYHRYRQGEKLRAGWVNRSDFEPAFPERTVKQ